MLLNPKDPLVNDKFWKVKETYQFSALHLVYKLPTYRTILTDLQQGLATLQSLVYGGPRGSFKDSAFWLPSCPRTFFNLVHHSLLSVVTSETLIFFQWAFLEFQLRNSLISKSLLCQDLIIFFFHLSFIHSFKLVSNTPNTKNCPQHWLDTHSYCPLIPESEGIVVKTVKSCTTMIKVTVW